MNVRFNILPYAAQPADYVPQYDEASACAALKGDAAALIGPGVRVYCERQIAAGAA